VPFPVRYLAIAAILAVGVFALLTARSKRSWLRQPDKFNLDPGKPEYLKGRTDDVTDLRGACLNACLVEMTG
jgi:hypothetical protein